MRRSGGHDSHVAITTAPMSPRDEQAHRAHRYLLSMGIRVVCFIGAVVVDGWLRWVLVAGAVILPYVAVVMANQASPSVPGTGIEDPDVRRRGLPPGNSATGR